MTHSGADGSRTFRLGNEQIRAELGAAGQLRALENPAAGETYAFSADGFAVESDLGTFSSRDRLPETVDASGEKIIYRFRFPLPSDAMLPVELEYVLRPENGFFRRTLRLHNPEPLRLFTIRQGRSEFAASPEESIHYLTFWQAPTVEFLRYRRGGWFTGIENPFYQAATDDRGIELSFPPGLILRAGEGYESEAQFFGVYRKSGVLIEDSGRPFRFPNASGYIPLDRNESRAMRRFALDYLHPEQPRFLNINYQFFHPLPQMPKNDAEADYYFKAIDTFAAIGGDMMIFNPLHPYAKPDAARPWWNLLPDDPASPAARIVRHATEKGIGSGFYMGCAAHGGEGNAAGLPVRPDRPEWKKTDAAGRRAPDNCLGCDAFYEWWFQVQDNTIKKYRLGNWSWDPSRGSAMNCHDESHGHLAGQGAYQGWRRCMELGRRLKAGNPGLFIQAFYGTKQFGLWGLADVDGHEVYNEQTAPVCTHHTQSSDDRQNADGLRFQNYWSMRFRFLPAVIGHPLVGRMSEGYFNSDLAKACDAYGWRYALMSALAVSGSIMPAILPYESRLLPGYAEFYRQWTAWAKQYFDYVPYTEPFGEQIQAGAIDGYARIKGAHGFIFLFNGNPRPAEIRFEIGDEINLQEEGVYELRELYPSEAGVTVADLAGKSIFARGDTARLQLPADSCRLLELRRAAAEATSLPLNFAATATQQDGLLALAGLCGSPGTRAPLYLRHPRPASVSRLTVNGRDLPFRITPEGLGAEIGFAGERQLRELDDWHDDNGRRFVFPNPDAVDNVRLRTRFHLAAGLPELLRQAAPPNAAEMDAQIAAWQRSDRFEYSYHNFIGCRPQRLWLVIPFLHFPAAAPVVRVNGRPGAADLRADRNGNAYHLDLTEWVRYGGDNDLELELAALGIHEFMGPFLLYPAEAATDQVVAAADIAQPEAPVVYTQPQPLPLPLKPRYRYGVKGPAILRAAMSGNVTLSKPARLEVTVDRPPEQLQKVEFTDSGFPWMGIGELKFDPARQLWTADIPPGPRDRIQESEYLHVRAIGADGLCGEYCPVRVEWDFLP